MLEQLNKKEIENLFKQQVTSRVACCESGALYIVPGNCVYDGKQT